MNDELLIRETLLTHTRGPAQMERSEHAAGSLRAAGPRSLSGVKALVVLTAILYSCPEGSRPC